MIIAPPKTPADLLPPNALPLGFGCGGLLGGRHRRDSLRLLATALDSGITYFDTARMYGVGDAEGILGELMPTVRHRIILASKGGILPTDRSLLPRLQRRAVKALRLVAPGHHIRVPPPAEPVFHVFDLPRLRKSLETSLRNLRTDYLDLFLLHECAIADVASPELLHFLETMKTQGKIRAFGLATGCEESIQIAEALPQLAAVIQIPSSIWDRNVRRLPARPAGMTVTHSCLTARFHAFAAELSADGAAAAKWRSLLPVDPLDKNAVAQIFLAHALRENAGGIVLFSSSKSANIRANVEMVRGGGVDPAQIAALEQAITATAPARDQQRASV
jgi:D-threo-aldose 1-dehydrogenase